MLIDTVVVTKCSFVSINIVRIVICIGREIESTEQSRGMGIETPFFRSNYPLND
jgi:hypothetical protein